MGGGGVRLKLRKRSFVILGLMLWITSCTIISEVPTQEPFEHVCAPLTKGPVARQDIAHVIGPAETIYRIGKMYDVASEAIIKANRISNPKRLKIGKKLLIPQASSMRPVIPIFQSCKWRYIVIHHSVTDAGDARFLDVIHRRRGFSRGLGYHFVIDNGTGVRADGQIESSPRWIKQLDGAHCRASGMNKQAIGICLVGDFTNTGPSESQMEALILLVNTLRDYYNIPLSRVIGHRDVLGASTECPGKSFPWGEFKLRLAYAGDGLAPSRDNIPF